MRRISIGTSNGPGLWWKGLSTWTEKGSLLKGLDMEQVNPALVRYGGGSGDAPECMRRTQMFLSEPKVLNDETIFHSIMPTFSSNFLTIPSCRPFSIISHHLAFVPSPIERQDIKELSFTVLEHWVSESYLLETLMRPVNCPAEFITHKEPELSSQSHDEHYGSKSRHKEDLEVQLHQPNPCRPIESLPSFEHGHGTATAQDLWFDFSGEGAVEGDNGVIFLR